MTKKIVIFNNTPGSHPIGVETWFETFENNLKTAGIKHRVVEIDDVEEYFWGDYETGRVVDKHDLPLIDEIAIDTLINKEVLSEYPVHTQLNIMADCIEQAGIPLTADFIAMRDFIKQKVANHNEAKEVYKNNPDVYAYWPKPTTNG